MHPSQTIKLIIADDHALIRQGFVALFSQHADIALLFTASNGKEVLDRIEETTPDVILTDIKMPVMDGRELCRAVRQRYPDIGVIACSMFDHEEAIIDMRKADAHGYLLKNADEGEILKAVRSVAQGGEYYCSAIRSRMQALFAGGRLGKGEEKKENYSDSELAVIRLVCEELSSKEIADHLQISKRTVEHQKERIQDKMGVHSSIGIAVYATKNWLLY